MSQVCALAAVMGNDRSGCWPSRRCSCATTSRAAELTGFSASCALCCRSGSCHRPTGPQPSTEVCKGSTRVSGNKTT